MTDDQTTTTTDETSIDATPTEVDDTPTDAPEEPDMFPREYVEQLRRESAELRVKAKDRETLAEELFRSRVAATGRLADPTDLPFDEALLRDESKLQAAIEGLLGRKPHLAARIPVGDIGQGLMDPTTEIDLAGMLRSAL